MRIPVTTAKEVSHGLPGVRVRRVRYWITEFGKAHIRRMAKAHEVSSVIVRPQLEWAQYVAILVVHNEANRIDFLLDYYRSLGFHHFILIDNNSSDGLIDQIRAMPDVSVFVAHGSYRKARYGIDWVNHLLNRHCSGKWILHVDADEFLVCGVPTGTTIDQITVALEAEGREALHTMMLDMYSGRPVSDNIYRSGTDPLDICPLYDGSGYIPRFNELERTTWIKGGPRARIFFRDEQDGPALNKTPLVRWRRHFAFLKSSHQLFPPRLNGSGLRPISNLDGVLLHFKFLSTFNDQVAEERERRQHTAEYSAYQELNSTTFLSPVTHRYLDWHSLVSDGLLRTLALTTPQQQNRTDSTGEGNGNA